jgi:hypothetical protein
MDCIHTGFQNMRIYDIVSSLQLTDGSNGVDFKYRSKVFQRLKHKVVMFDDSMNSIPFAQYTQS